MRVAKDVLGICNQYFNTDAFLINRGHSTPLENGIPDEAWSGKEVNLLFLRVFGCVAYGFFLNSVAYVLIEVVARSKLDAKSVKIYVHWLWW